MKLHIENIHIHLGNNQPPAGLIAALAIAGAAKSAKEEKIDAEVPAIGEKWPGLNATYAGISPSQDGQSLVHLILWDKEQTKGLNHADAVEFAEKINPGMESHLPTHHQGIVLFERLRHLFDSNYGYWLQTKTNSGKSAFLQYFDDGDQGIYDLSAELRVRAVSEIPL